MLLKQKFTARVICVIECFETQKLTQHKLLGNKVARNECLQILIRISGYEEYITQLSHFLIFEIVV